MSSELVYAGLPTEKNLQQYDVKYEPRSSFLESDDAITTRFPKLILHRHKSTLIHAQLIKENTAMLLRQLALQNSASTVGEAVLVTYSTPILPHVCFVEEDQELHYWLLTLDGQIIRHRLRDIFSGTFSQEDVLIMPLESSAHRKPISLSVASRGVATIGYDDGTVTHVQDLEQNKGPSTVHGVIIIHKDEKFCEYKLHQPTTFLPLLCLRLLGKAIRWKTESTGDESNIQGRVSALVSQNRATVGLRQDHQMCIWVWNGTTSSITRKLVELPRFDGEGNLLGAEEQDMTCLLPGSFEKPPIAHELSTPQVSVTDNYLVQLLPDGSRIIVYVDANEAPFFAIYDVESRKGSIDSMKLSQVAVVPRQKDRKLIQFTASHSNGSLRLWMAWQHLEQITLTTLSVESDSTSPLVLRPMCSEISPAPGHRISAPLDMHLLDNTQLLIATSDGIAAARNYDSLETLIYENIKHASQIKSSNECILGKGELNSLSTISSKLDAGARDILESRLRASFRKGSPEAFYEDELKTLNLALDMTCTPKKEMIAQLLGLMVESKEYRGVEVGPIIQDLVISATSQIIASRFEMGLTLLVLLAHSVYGRKDTSFEDLLLSTWELLRTLDALRWLQTKDTERMLQQGYPVDMPENARFNIGVSAYHRFGRIARPDMTIDICDTLAVLGAKDLANEMTETFLNEKKMTMSVGGKKGDKLRSVQFRRFLVKHDFEKATAVLANISDKTIQERLLDDLLAQAYAAKEYKLICQALPVKELGLTRVGDAIIRFGEMADKEEKEEVHSSENDRLSWWQIGYSFFTLAGDSLNGNKCMRKYLKETGARDELLMSFFTE
ncbi:hypothetical protein BX666DRAFT_2030761 [Dichotomocladium elegans]|nr:hypothetical protein BX666DRAFT_2030761 [Dichotomocladium elegans]